MKKNNIIKKTLFKDTFVNIIKKNEKNADLKKNEKNADLKKNEKNADLKKNKKNADLKKNKKNADLKKNKKNVDHEKYINDNIFNDDHKLLRNAIINDNYDKIEILLKNYKSHNDVEKNKILYDTFIYLSDDKTKQIIRSKFKNIKINKI